MKVEDLRKEHFDEIFRELLIEKRSSSFISTFDFADKLWEKFRIPYKKRADDVRKKLRAWWDSYEWKPEPRYHKIICGTAVYLCSPMSYDYCMLATRKSVIAVYHNQGEFVGKK